MAEKPIIFSTEMVSAILDERKSMTRRVIRPQPPEFATLKMYGEKPSCFYCVDREQTEIRIPYQKGDLLWVRETWSKDENGEYVYRSNYGTTKDDSFPPTMFKWKPSIYMPREAARIFLRVTGVRVERLQDITEKDAHYEGVHPWGLETQQRMDKWCRYTQITDPGRMTGTFRGEFAAFWDSLNAKRGYGWKENPWVWVIEFRKEVIKHD